MSNNKSTTTTHCWSTVGVWGTVTPRCERLNEVLHCRNCEVFANAGRAVLEKKVPGGYMADWRQSLSMKVAGDDKGSIGIIVFRIGKEWYAITAATLQEVASMRPVHSIPGNTSMYILGVVNIGGEVTLCHSLASILDVTPDASATAYQRMLVLMIDNLRYVFPVDEVQGVIRYNQSELEVIPSTLSEGQADLLGGILSRTGKQIGILDIEKIHTYLERLAA